ncbi:MAG: hypothetical protein QG635_179 [Bacteroidota bacterium]|nr:hypothetical protein [Bacteroidota bacterium]
MKKNGLNIVIILIAALLVSGLSLQAEQKAVRIEINPLNRACIYFDEYPINYTSQLSEDKRKVTITINNCSAIDTARNKQSLGILDNVYIQIEGKNIRISITMREKRGYTATPLPYSRALVVEVFNWDKLSSAEDSYRSGLLAIESGINNKAKFDLSAAARENISEASFFLGLINLNEGNIKPAAENFRNALKSKINIPDIYAAVSQLYKIYELLPESAKYAELFRLKSGVFTYSDMQIIGSHFSDSAGKNRQAVLEILRDPIFSDSVFNLSSSFNRDSNKSEVKENKDSNRIILKTTKKKENTGLAAEIIQSMFPDWFFGMFGYLVVGIAALVLFILYSYIKWRKNQLSQRNKGKTKVKFKENLKEARKLMTGSARQAANLYSQNDPLNKPGTKPEKPKKPPAESKANETLPSREDFESAVNNISETLLGLNTNSDKDSNKKNIKDDLPEETVDFSKNKKMPPRLELAMHLQDEQRKIKSGTGIQSAKSLEQIDLNKLNEVARKFGIEPEKTRAKSISTQFDSDKDILEKLSDKFNRDKKEDG